MGEYCEITIYKPMKRISSLSNVFDKTCWKLFEAKDDKTKIEQIYREINFVTERGGIFDLNMRFLEMDGVIYQTNRGVLSVKELPNLSFGYKYYFHDFWLSIVKPSELKMDKNGYIETKLRGSVIHDRFFEIERCNKNKPEFKNSSIYRHYYEEEPYPSIQRLVNDQDIIELTIGMIYYSENEAYRDSARKAITKQRKEIASNIFIPHWATKK